MDLFAAIDVGSNSVRLQIAAFISGFQHHVVHEERAVTRLGESVFQSGRLSEEAIERTAQVVKRFRSKAEEYKAIALRAVGTSALRDAGNAKRFIKTVKRESGLDVDVISAREEARLIHLGVISRLANPDEPALLIDIGGGSAEFTLNQNRRIQSSSSVPLGAVRLTEMFLTSDPPTAEELERLESYVRQKLQRVKKALAGAGGAQNSSAAGKSWNRAIGTSGTMAALARATNRLEAGRSEVEGTAFTATDLDALYRRLRAMNLNVRRAVSGINAKRAEIIVAGAAAVSVAMRELEVPEITYSDAGLRDGVLVDLAARQQGDAAAIQHLNADRLESVRSLGERYGYVPSHSGHVALLARQLFQLLQPLHELPDSYAELLEAAALLHDVGHYVNSSKHHKHTYYLLANSELPGYSDRERLIIATLARYHRGSFPSAEHDGYSELPPKEQRAVQQLAPLLRLADACDNGRRRVVQSVLATPRSDRVDITLLTSAPAELETWAAEKSSALFRRVYGRKLHVQAQMMKPVVTPS